MTPLAVHSILEGLFGGRTPAAGLGRLQQGSDTRSSLPCTPRTRARVSREAAVVEGALRGRREKGPADASPASAGRTPGTRALQLRWCPE